MAKCFSCGKSFDYEKYYGICPKCGAYNRENTAREEHQELHEKYDTTEQHTSHYDAGYGSGYYGGVGSGGMSSTTGTMSQERKASPAGTIIFVLLIIGILLSMALPFLYAFGRTMGLGADIIYEFGDSDIYEPDTGDVEEPSAQREQTAQILPAAAGETISLGRNGEMTVTVTGARVILPAGHVSDFPEEDNLVGIAVSYANDYQDYYSYNALDALYVGYNGSYKLALDSYDVEEYRNILKNIPIVDEYNIASGSGQGEILVFVPKEVTSLEFYLESRDESDCQLLEIFQIPLDIEPGREF